MIQGKCESIRTEIRQKEVSCDVTKTVNHQFPNATRKGYRIASWKVLSHENKLVDMIRNQLWANKLLDWFHSNFICLNFDPKLLTWCSCSRLPLLLRFSFQSTRGSAGLNQWENLHEAKSDSIHNVKDIFFQGSRWHKWHKSSRM